MKKIRYVLLILICMLAFIPNVKAWYSEPASRQYGEAYNSPTNPYAANGYKGQCTWYVWGRYYEKTGIKLPGAGNAMNWASDLSSYVSSDAKPNSIIILGPSNYSSVGHVVYYEEIRDGKACVSEGNYDGYGNWDSSYHEDCNRYASNIYVGANYYGNAGGQILGFINAPEIIPDPYVPSGSVKNLGTNFKAMIIPKANQNFALSSTAKANGDKVTLANKSTLILNQQWKFVRRSDGTYNIYNAANNGTHALDVYGTGYTNEEQVQVWNPGNGAGDKVRWYIYDYNGAYRLVPASGNKYRHALDIYGGNFATSSKIELYEAINATNNAQTFLIEKMVENVTVNNTSLTMIEGDTKTITATVTPSDFKATYTSSNTSVAKVDSNGKITAVKAGSAVITVTAKSNLNTVTKKVNVTVNSKVIYIDHIDKITNYTKTMYVGDSKVLDIIYSPSNTTEKATLSSSDSSVLKVDQNGKITALKAGKASINFAYKKSDGNTWNQSWGFEVLAKTKTSVSYTTHVQNIGWQSYVKNGAMAGTSGKALRLEGIKIKLENQEYTGNVEYQTHIQNIGWEKEYKKNNVMSGTSGMSYRLEAIRIKLTGEMANHYDIYYRVHAENFGWLDWTKNGESAGTAGYAYRLEGIEIKLVEKGGKAPGATTNPFRQRLISYQTHVQNIGWQENKYDGEMSGTSGKALRLEGIKIKLENQKYSGNIEYKTHIQNIGWEKAFKKNGEMSGTSGKSYRLEAIQIKLTGDMSKYYDIYYRVHAENFGWLDWAKNGASAGTAGYAYRLEGIEIKLVEKGGSAPGKTTRPFVEK